MNSNNFEISKYKIVDDVFLGGINLITDEFEETGYTAKEMFLQTDDNLSKLNWNLWHIKKKEFSKFSLKENLPQKFVRYC